MSDPLLLKALASLGAVVLLFAVLAPVFGPIFQAWLKNRENRNE